MLEAHGLTKSYASVIAVKGVSFTLAPGQVLGCLGPNGSGKSTTVKMLTGLLEPSRGRILFNGEDIHQDLTIFRKLLGYVPEEPNLYPYLSGHEYLEMIGLLRGIPRSTLDKKTDSLLHLFSLDAHRHASMASYSKGMRQRILLIAALMDDPKLLIFDEPLSGLDVTTALVLKNLIRELGQQGRAVFYCSHVLEVVEQVCSHLLILRKGEVLAYDTTEAIRHNVEHSSLEKAFVHMVEEVDTSQIARDVICAMGGTVSGLLAALDSRTRYRPFPLLVRLFIARVFRGSGTSEDTQLDLSIGLILALLALPGAFYSLFLLEKYSTLLQWMQGQKELDPLAGALPDEYFFIVLSMVVTGVVAVWRWDSIFPDRRDYANLVPLPISLRSIFLANLAAILLLALLLAADVNAASAVLFPLVVSASENTFAFFLHFVGIHAFVVVLASVFSFCAVFAIVGALMLAVPYGSFRRISFYLRATLLACLVAMLSTSFAVPSMLPSLPNTSIRFLPPVWFLGLCQLLRGRATEPLAVMGHIAFASTASSVIAGIAIYALSYRRRFVRIPETADVSPSVNRESGAWVFRAPIASFWRAHFNALPIALRSRHSSAANSTAWCLAALADWVSFSLASSCLPL